MKTIKLIILGCLLSLITACSTFKSEGYKDYVAAGTYLIVSTSIDKYHLSEKNIYKLNLLALAIKQANAEEGINPEQFKSLVVKYLDNYEIWEPIIKSLCDSYNNWYINQNGDVKKVREILFQISIGIESATKGVASIK